MSCARNVGGVFRAAVRRTGLLLVATAAVAATCQTQQSLSERPSIAPPAHPTGAPTSLSITCSSDGIAHASAQYVQARADGVHLRLVDAQNHVSWVVEPSGPGEYSRSCGTPNWCDMPADATAAADSVGCAWYLVVDPHRYYHHVSDKQADCMVGTDFPGSGVLVLRPGETLERALRRDLVGVKPTDQARLDGYPDADPLRIDVVRRGSIVATASYHHLAAAKWERKDLAACDGSGLNWKPRG